MDYALGLHCLCSVAQHDTRSFDNLVRGRHAATSFSVMLLRPLLNLPNTSRTLTTSLYCLAAVSNLSHPFYAHEHTICSAAMSQPPTSEWLQEHLSTLLASPYIHFNQPSFPGLHLRMGPGPIDLFSTRFSNTFTKDATGVVGGKEVDRDGLKQSLLALQKKWNKDTAKFVDAQPSDAAHSVSGRAGCVSYPALSRPSQAATKFSWTPKEADTAIEVSASAT